MATWHGTALTQTDNWFSDPPQQLPRLMDALASFTKGGHIAGHIFHLDKTKFKVNSIMALNKPGGHIRVVGNLKAPIGQSFNEGISEDIPSVVSIGAKAPLISLVEQYRKLYKCSILEQLMMAHLVL